MSKFVGQKVIVRSDRAGVFFGTLVSNSGNVVTMKNAQKIHYWDGACAVEQLAVDGIQLPKDSRLTVVVDEMEIANAIQIIPCTEKAILCLEGIPVWKK
jgi:hypothetical protein